MSVVSSARWVNAALVVIAMGSVLSLVWSGRSASRAEAGVRRGHLLPVFRSEEVSRIELSQGARRSVIVRRAPALTKAPASGKAAAQEQGADSEKEPEPAASTDDTDGLGSEWRLSEPCETD